MCGISGILNLGSAPPVDEDLLARMVAIQGYRGPDESGLYLEPEAG